MSGSWSSYFGRLAAYNTWANLRLYAACDELSESAYLQPRAAFFGGIHGTLNHILVGDRIWFARFEGRQVFAFTRPGDEKAENFARALGASWAGPSDAAPPEPLDAAIIFAPVGALVPAALRAVAPGGRVVCAGIHMSDIPSFPYDILWGEREIVSVANLTRRDSEEFLALAPRVPVVTTVVPYALEDANQALSDLREGRISGAAVLETGA